MVKVLCFLIGLCLFVGGSMSTIVAIMISIQLMVFLPGLIIHPTLAVLGFFLLRYALTADEKERRRKLEHTKRMQEAQEIKETELRKKRFLEEQQWKKELAHQYCTECGNKIEIDNNFCSYCSVKI